MMTVRDVMSHKVVSVGTRAPLPDVARLLVEHRISGLPVVDDDGAVVGVVSEADFLVKEQGPEAVHRGPFARFLAGSRASRRRLAKLAATTAGEAMTSPAVTIEPYRSISEAATRMASRGINRLPVVDGETLVGIVTRADLVRAYTRTDEELERTIREEVLLRSLWLDPASFTGWRHGWRCLDHRGRGAPFQRRDGRARRRNGPRRHRPRSSHLVDGRRQPVTTCRDRPLLPARARVTAGGRLRRAARRPGRWSGRSRAPR